MREMLTVKFRQPSHLSSVLAWILYPIHWY
jgi:hypothetical protein